MEQTYPFQSYSLPYSYVSLMPYCDANTLYFHHDKYYTDAVYNLNQLVVKHRLTSLNMRQLLTDDINLPTVQLNRLRDTAGIVYNHGFYFNGVNSAPSDSPPVNDLTRAIIATYGSMPAFLQLMVEAGEGAPGSSWLWLVSEGIHGLHLVVTPDNFAVDLNSVTPILAVDLWEHAYFPMNHFDKGAYIRDWFTFINWTDANQRYMASFQQP